MVRVLAGQFLRADEVVTINQRSYVVDTRRMELGPQVNEPIEPVAILVLYMRVPPWEPSLRSATLLRSDGTACALARQPAGQQ